MKILPLRFKGSIAACLAVILATVHAPAHNLDTTKTSISFALDYFEQMSQRAAAQHSLIQQNDEFWVLLKTTPVPVTATGVDRGMIAGVYADTGIFFSIDPRTALNSYWMPKPPLTGPPLPMKNHSGDAVGKYYGESIKAGSVNGMGKGGRA